MESRIEVRNGRTVRVDVLRRDAGGHVITEYVEPLDDAPVMNAAIHNVPMDPNTGLPIQRFDYEQAEADALEPLPLPVFNFGGPPKPEVETDNGLPVLPLPVFNWSKGGPKGTAKARTVPNETDDGMPVLPTPGYGR